VSTPGIALEPSRTPSSNPGGAAPASAEADTVSPRWGSEGRRGEGRASEPAAHAVGYMMPPRWGSDGEGDRRDAPEPAAHAASCTMSPLGAPTERAIVATRPNPRLMPRALRCRPPGALMERLIVATRPTPRLGPRAIRFHPAAHAAGHTIPPRLAPRRSLPPRFRNAVVLTVVPISQAPSRNLLSRFNMRKSVGLCRLVRRPAVTLWYTMRYKKTLVYSD
jgi:hypothetical protein